MDSVSSVESNSSLSDEKKQLMLHTHTQLCIPSIANSESAQRIGTHGTLNTPFYAGRNRENRRKRTS